MSRVLVRGLLAFVLLTGCGLFASARLALPAVTYTRGPVGIGNPPAAGKLEVDISWANCTGAATVVTSVWAVPAGQNPLQTPSFNTTAATGAVVNSGFGLFQSGTKVQFVTEVRDANGAVIARTQSNPVTVP